MNLEQFRASREWCEDLRTALPDNAWEADQIPPCGYVYAGSFYIDHVMPHWAEAARKRGAYHLQLGREEYVTDDVEALEWLLFDYTVLEGASAPAEIDPVSHLAGIISGIGLGFHYDTRGVDYVDSNTGKRLFTDDEAADYEWAVEAAAGHIELTELAMRVWYAMGLVSRDELDEFWTHE